jgi:hypothetical protein
MNESVQYRHHHDGDSCHGHVGQGVGQVAIGTFGSHNIVIIIIYCHIDIFVVIIVIVVIIVVIVVIVLIVIAIV